MLRIGVVNDVHGALPVTHAPTPRDAESHICHPKRCGQPKPRKVVKGTESATLVKPNEHVELKGHRDPDPEQLMLPEWVDVKDASRQSKAYAVTGQQEAQYSTVQPLQKGPSMAKWYAAYYPSGSEPVITRFDVNMTPMECMDLASTTLSPT